MYHFLFKQSLANLLDNFRCSQTDILVEQAFIDIVVFLQNCPGAVGRGIIDDNHLNVRVSLVQGTVYGLPQILLVVVTGDYYADKHFSVSDIFA